MTLVSKRWPSTAVVAFVVALGVFRVSPASAATPPPNDDFDHATVITTTPFTDTVDTSGATVAGDDPATCGSPRNTVWYSITPAVNETITANATGSGFPDVSAYSGARGALSQVACASGPFSNAHWSATAGVTYHIMVSAGPAFFPAGTLTISATAALPPANDDFDHATVIATTPFTDTVDTTGATTTPDDPTTCGTPENTVWYSITPAVNEVLTANTGNGFFTSSAYTGTRGALSQVACGNGFSSTVRWSATAGVTYHIMVSSGPPFNTPGILTLTVTASLPPPNDDFDHATVIPAVPFTATEDVTGATAAPDDPRSCGGTSSQSVWFSFTPSANETVFASASGNGPIFSSAYTGLRGSLTQVGCGSFFTPATWSATAGVTYHIMVASSDGSASSVTLQVTAVIPPPNDDFDHATVVSALPFTTAEAVGGATAASDDPTGCGSTDNSVWFSVTPSINETLIANTGGSNYQTAVSVYTGSRGALTRVACQNGPFQGVATKWAGTAGVTYHIMVANLFGGANPNGQLSLNLTGATPPPNDDFDHATVVSSLPFTDSLDASGATSAPDDPTSCGSTDSSVWYDVTTTINEQITADTTGSSYSPIVSAYTGSRGSLTEVACGGPFSSITSFPATAGVTYHIMVASSPFFGTAGHLALTLQGAQAPVITKTFGASSILVNGTTSLSFTVTNPNATTAVIGIGFGDPLPAGMVVSTPSGLSGSCGNGQIQAPSGTGFVALSGATLAGGASCTFSMNVTATTAGVDVNSVTVNSANGGTGNTSTASLTVIGPPLIAKVFGDQSIPFGGMTALFFGLANPNTTLALNGVGFTDTLPAGLVVSTPNGLSGSCFEGSITAAAGSGSVTVSNVTLDGGASCVFSINVTATSVGTDNNTTSAVTSANGGTGPPATATLTVVKAPTTTTLTVSSASTDLAAPVSFTATVAPSGPNAAGVGPTGTVSFFLDGNATPMATVALNGTTASFTTSGLGAGPHTVTARYSGDANFAPSSSTVQTTVTCTTMVSGNHAGLVLGPGSTCVLNGRIAGSVVVPRGASLDLEGSSVAGSINASGASFVRICGTSASALVIGRSTGPVLIGDSGDDGCAPNTLRGSMVLSRNTGGVEAIGNHVRGAVIATGNSGSGPLPEDTAPEIGATDPARPAVTPSTTLGAERFWLR